MTRPSSPEGLEPLDAVDAKILPTTPRSIRTGLRLNIRGRSVHLRGLRRSPTGLLRWLAILGPGLIATSAGNDAGGIATYSQAGARVWLRPHLGDGDSHRFIRGRAGDVCASGCSHWTRPAGFNSRAFWNCVGAVCSERSFNCEWWCNSQRVCRHRCGDGADGR